MVPLGRIEDCLGPMRGKLLRKKRVDASLPMTESVVPRKGENETLKETRRPGAAGFKYVVTNLLVPLIRPCRGVDHHNGDTCHQRHWQSTGSLSEESVSSFFTLEKHLFETEKQLCGRIATDRGRDGF